LVEFSKWPAARRWVVIGELWMLPDSNVASHYRDVAVATDSVADRVITVGAPWLEHRGAWQGLDVPVDSVVTVAEATALLASEVSAGDLIYLKGDEDFRLRRITLALLGRRVTCNRVECRRRELLCDVCPDLGK
jgi:UDP-N-acetylmuramyl pentapeptide synthase